MPTRRAFAGVAGAFAALLLACGSAFALATARREAPDAAVSLPGRLVTVEDRARQEAFNRSPAWRDFVARNGAWHALWNEQTGTPHRAFGRGIALPGFAGDAASVDAAVRGFIARNPGLFGGAPQLATVSVERGGAMWYAHYRQIAAGMPVLFSDWEFRVGVNGRLCAFGADARQIDTGAAARPAMAPAAAREAAKRGLAFDAATDRVEGASRLSWLPLPTEQGIEYRSVFDVRVTTSNPPGNWITYVDANSGEVLWRHDRVRYAVSGRVTATVHLGLPTGELTARPLPDAGVAVGAAGVFTSANGDYSAPASGAVHVVSRISGRYCSTERFDGASAALSLPATDPAVVDIAWDLPNSHVAERDAYYFVNVAHEHAKRIDPGFTGLDYPVPCRVNIASTCNAFWDGNGINFYAAGGGCPNTATMSDVVWHEYGHGVTDYVYLQHGAPFGLVNAALHEGLADLNAAFIADDPNIGKGFTGEGTVLRTIANDDHYPEDVSGDVHLTGLIVAGAFWDLRQAVGLPVADHLAHYMKFGIPDDPDDGVAMSEVFLETLIADDDDADLANGTPHFTQILTAFERHGIGTGYFIAIDHAGIADPASAGPYAIDVGLRYTGPFGALAPGTALVRYSVNGGAPVTTPLAPTGAPDVYRALIPAPPAAIVRYSVEAHDTYGGVAVAPPGAPAKLFTFVTGAQSVVTESDFETDPGWATSAPGDDAVTGLWVRDDPVGSAVGFITVQPEDDHSPDGTRCYVTGNADSGFGAGVNDVDGGRTTLTSTRFDVAGLDHPMVEYYRWYTNNSGAFPGEDFWVVELSNDDGATWRTVERTILTDASWRRVVTRIEDVLPPTDRMRIRFVASDDGEGSIVEAAVDDFRVFGFHAGPDCSAARARIVGGAWPPNHRLAPVLIDGITARDGSPVTVTVTAITQDEPVTGGRDDDEEWTDGEDVAGTFDQGAADALQKDKKEKKEKKEGKDKKNATCPDATMAADGRARVRVERDGHGNGRVYTLRFRAADGSGACEGTVTVCVPHSKRSETCTDDGRSYNSLAPCRPDRDRTEPETAPTATEFRVARVTGSEAIFEFALPEPADVTIAIFDIAGRRLTSVLAGPQAAGRHEAIWDATGIPNGMYFCRMQTRAAVLTRPVLLAR